MSDANSAALREASCRTWAAFYDLMPTRSATCDGPDLVTLDADAARKTLAALITHMVSWSPDADTLHNPVHLDVALAPVTAAA